MFLKISRPEEEERSFYLNHNIRESGCNQGAFAKGPVGFDGLTDALAVCVTVG